MLTLTGTIRAAQTLPAFTNRKTGEISPARPVLQLEGVDSRGLVVLYTMTVPSLADYADQIGKQITVPVRAWAPGAQVQLSYEAPR